MGGHISRQSLGVSTNVVTKAALDVTQSCLAFMDGTQVISIYGSGNIFRGNIQRSTLSVDSKCMSQMSQQGEFENSLENSITQAMKDQEVAMTQWISPGKNDQMATIAQDVTTKVTFTDVQNCVSSLQGTQLFIVSGNDNVVVDNMQDQTLSLAASCLMSGGQVTGVTNDITNTVNQHSTYDSENPFAFITDAIEAVFGSAAAMAALVFIAIVVLVFVYEVRKRKHRKAEKQEKAAAAAAAAAAAGRGA